MLDQNQWQQITNITSQYLATGDSEPEHIYAEIYWQLGQGVAENDIGWDQIPWIIDHVWRDRQGGYSNEEISARLIANVQPWLPSAQGGVPEQPGGLLTSDQRSAKANLDGFLSQYGLDSLGDFVWQEYLNNIPIEQIMLDIRGRDEYKQRFPGMQTLMEKGHAMSEAEYIAYEKQVAGFARAVGMPAEMFDQPEDFKDLFENELSVQEVSQRIEDWVNFADTAPEANKLELQRLYGIGTADIAAYFMNPDKALPLLEKQANAALTGVSSIASGYGELGQGEAEYIAGLGYKPEQTREGFGNLVNQRELFNPLDQGEDVIGREQQLQAMFGANATAQQAIERRASRRAAQFQQGGGFIEGKEGFAGVGSAR